MAVCAAVRANPGAGRQADVRDGYASTHILVRLTPAATTRVAAALPLQARSRADDPRPFLDDAFSQAAMRWGVTRVEPLYADPFGQPQAARAFDLDAIYVLRVPRGTATSAMVAAFRALRNEVTWATVDVIGGVSQFIPNDARFSEQYGLHNKGPFHFEGLLRVPMMWRWPGRFAQQSTASLASLLDLPPTILDLAGVPIPEGPGSPEAVPDQPPAWPGRSLRPLLMGEAVTVQDSVVVENDEDYLGLRLRTLVTSTSQKRSA